MDPDALERMMRMIRPYRFTVQDVQGTWKLAQNKSAEARLAAADQVAQHDIGVETEALAALMQSIQRKVTP
jgi:transcriptional regulator